MVPVPDLVSGDVTKEPHDEDVPFFKTAETVKVLPALTLKSVPAPLYPIKTLEPEMVELSVTFEVEGISQAAGFSPVEVKVPPLSVKDPNLLKKLPLFVSVPPV